MKSRATLEAEMGSKAKAFGAKVTIADDGEVTICHPKDAIPREAHERAKVIKGFAIVETFRDGWGNIISRGRVSKGEA